MKRSTREIKFMQARTLKNQWALLSKPRRKYAHYLVDRYAYPVRFAIETAYVFGFVSFPYDYRAKRATTESRTAKSFGLTDRRDQEPTGDRYEVHQISAMMQEDESWYYNETWKMFEYTTTAADRARAFRRALARFGISFIKGRTRTESDGDVLEIVDRKTGEPLFCAYPMED